MAEKTVQVQADEKFNERVRLGTVAGLPLFFNYSFLLWFLFIIFIDPIKLVLFVSLLFFSVLIHELAHALTSRYLGLGSGTLTIWFLGGFFIPFSETALVEMSTSQRIKYAFMVLAGPLSNVILAGLFILLAYATSMNLLYTAAQFNLSLAILNLLPVGYLDGGNIVRYLGSIVVDWRKIVHYSGILSFVLAAAVFVSISFSGAHFGWVGFLIGMGIGAINMAKKTDEELVAKSQKTMDRELAITETSSLTKEASGLPSMIVKTVLASLVIFSIGYLFNQYWTYKDLPGRIAFIDANKSDHRLHLYITGKLGFPTIDADGTPSVSYTNFSYLTDPRIIAFQCDSDSSARQKRTSICIDDYSGERIAKIATGVKELRSLALSPDAQKLAFSTPQEGVYVADISSGVVEQIHTEGDVAAWSPDGSYILINGKGEILRTDPLGKDVRNLTNNSAADVLSVSTHDGQYIYFVSDRNGEYGLFRMDRDGSNVNKIVLENEIHVLGLGLRLSPDDTRLLFSCSDWGESICVVKVDGTEEHILAKGYVATWSPDSKYVAVTGSHQGAIFIVTPDGKQSVRLKNLVFITWDLAWLP